MHATSLLSDRSQCWQRVAPTTFLCKQFLYSLRSPAAIAASVFLQGITSSVIDNVAYAFRSYGRGHCDFVVTLLRGLPNGASAADISVNTEIPEYIGQPLMKSASNYVQRVF